ncbi:MAG: hypothetical protein AB2L14_09895 [Candidatus Xenobiia bacterium LiM19]
MMSRQFEDFNPHRFGEVAPPFTIDGESYLVVSGNSRIEHYR